MPSIQLKLFQTSIGKSPVLKWFFGLRDEEWIECRALLKLLKAEGPELDFPDSKPLGRGLFELRGAVGRVQLRLLYCYLPESRAVVLCGFLKQQQKTPKAELDRARERREQVLREPDRYILGFDPDDLEAERRQLKGGRT